MGGYGTLIFTNKLNQVPQNRRDFLALAAAGSSLLERLRPIVVTVNALLDLGAHSGKGLSSAEIAAFKNYQEKARREYAKSAIHFDVRLVEGAYLRTQGYSEIHPKFLAPKTINVFVTDTLGYDMDRDRTGGCSVGPHPPMPKIGGDRFYKTFLGLREAAATTLAHEYAHHFTLDTLKNPTTAAHLWADLRNDYWLWRQRHGVPIFEFRRCANSEWAKLEPAAASRL